jgi:hypothetical protein
LRIVADAAIVKGAPTDEPVTIIRTTPCNTMNLNG